MYTIHPKTTTKIFKQRVTAKNNYKHTSQEEKYNFVENEDYKTSKGNWPWECCLGNHLTSCYK